MNQFRSRTAVVSAALMMAAAALLPASGCNVLATGMYVFKGNAQAAEFNDLRGKRVAVVCRPVTSLQFRNGSVAPDLAKYVGVLLTQNVKKITVVKQSEVGQWADDNNWEEYVEIGKGVNADFVVGLDLEEFSLYQGQTLYQGKANIAIKVYDVAKGKEAVWEKQLPQSHYPPNSAIPAGEKPESQFRAQFVKVLAEQIARYFYEHDPTANFASDSTVLN